MTVSGRPSLVPATGKPLSGSKSRVTVAMSLMRPRNLKLEVRTRLVISYESLNIDGARASLPDSESESRRRLLAGPAAA